MSTAARVEVVVDEPYAGAAPVHTLRRVAELVIARELRSGPRLATVSVTDDETLRDLNRKFRGISEVTDVLSFGVDGARDGRVPDEERGFTLAPGEPRSLGDVVISFPQAQRQAATAGRPVEHELALLTAHGMLHLLGFDHAEQREEVAMFAMTEGILSEALGPDAMPIAPLTERAAGDAGAGG